jgi:hypothetical protein
MNVGEREQKIHNTIFGAANYIAGPPSGQSTMGDKNPCSPEDYSCRPIAEPGEYILTVAVNGGESPGVWQEKHNFFT